MPTARAIRQSRQIRSASAAAQVISRDPAALRILGFTGDLPDTARPASPAEAEGLPAFGRGVELLASAVANTDWYAARQDRATGEWRRLAEQPAIVEEPDRTTDQWQWRYSATVDLIEYGNHVSILGPPNANGWPSELIPVAIDTVTVINDRGSMRYSIAGVGDDFEPSDVLHISAGNRSGDLIGRGALRQYADALGHAVAAERYSSRWFNGGGLPPGLIAWASQPSPQVNQDFKAQWRKLMTTGEPISLPQGVTVTPLAQEADKAQLVESRTWNAQLTGMVLGIPPHLFGLPGTAMTYQNVESADIGFVRDTVDRWAQPIARAFSKAVLPRGQSVRFDYESRMRTNAAGKADYVTTLVGAGIMTVEEARRQTGLPPLTEGGTP